MGLSQHGGVTLSKLCAASALAAALIVPLSASAAPMGFKGSSMWMVDLSRDEQSLYANYAVTRQWAPGFGWYRFGTTMSGERGANELQELNLTHLAKRWNMPHAQANLWLFAGVGQLRENDGMRSVQSTSLSPGIQFDYETTRLYFAASSRWIRGGTQPYDSNTIRAGFSFYNVEYEQVQPWLVLQAKRVRNVDTQVVWTPMLRLIHKNIFVEIGTQLGKLAPGQQRSAQLNFMYTY